MRRALDRGLVVFLLVSFPVGAFPQSAVPAKTDTTPSGLAVPLRSVATEQAPKAAGPYSQAVIVGGFLFVSGQLPIDPKTGDLVTGGFEQSAERVLDNLEAILKAEGLSFADVVKTTVYLVKADDFAAMNGVYARRMGENKPARSAVVVAGLPKGAPLEIDLVARTKR
jgi:2-iminobutanoate/2-iminopropanoate deaminase